ncbi:uncharacterized protein PHALS_13024 [Plasmopara halstedii]|uniref:Uncharacterized protein n=1 Tax=Plasmopara halstedii TaxID=4781 RepID=A0A0P1ANE5_PLAHL|nr:uncharacterized protein PHALS_13024 [Plasmopara halstedii]CEG42775.1 hypothetical protein PHALS_13024 [Plasmopara halstedii]|eukprot:XP_024579144.1 hypothetical protein PHALS_13024 [Plasmopara halstedii]
MTGSPSTSTQLTSSNTTTKNSTISNGNSPNKSSDNKKRGGCIVNTQQSSSSDGNSPMRCLPAVLRTSSSDNSTTNTSSTTTTTTDTTTRLLKAQSTPESSQTHSCTTSTTNTGNRENTGVGRRHLYPTQSLPSPYNGNGTFSPGQMSTQYYESERGRITTGSSSYNPNHSSPTSSPAMTDQSWAGNMSTRGIKRHLPHQYDGYTSRGANVTGLRLPDHRVVVQNGTKSGTQLTLRRGPSSINSSRSAPLMQPMYTIPPSEDPRQYEPSGEARHPRDSTRYETWTSKQLRKKCSHLKLRGLKNVKKHVMVEALYRYYRNQRLKEMADAASTENMTFISHSPGISSPQQQAQQRRMDTRRPSSVGTNSMLGTRSESQYQLRYDQRNSQQASPYDLYSTRSRNYGKYGSQSPSPPSSGGDSHPQRPGLTKSDNSGYYQDEENKTESHFKEVPVTSEDVIRLVDVVLSAEFVDRLAAELSRWQFWVDVREMYIALLNRQHPPGSNCAKGEGGPLGSGSATNSRNFKWSSMQLWEIWKELSFAYTKTCFEFTAAGMNKRVDDREYIKFCNGRPDVYYLHQRLHLRPDLLHLIKSNEYIDEKCTSEASESIAHEQQQAQKQQQAGPLVGSGSPMLRTLKRYKRSAPIAVAGTSSGAYDSARAIAAFRNGTACVDGAGTTDGVKNEESGPVQRNRDSRGPSPEENSTENSETTGEEGSSNANSNASNSSQDVSMRAALAEQKYFGLLLQNFEVIFESLHNKKVLLATLRKDSKAPDQLIADLHDDIHVLSALKKDFRNKLRRTIQ